MDIIQNLISGAKPTIKIEFTPVENRPEKSFRKSNGAYINLPTYYDGENVSGKVYIYLNSSKKLEHEGIKVDLIGIIDMNNDKKNQSRFITLTKDLEPSGKISFFIINLLRQSFE